MLGIFIASYPTNDRIVSEAVLSLQVEEVFNGLPDTAIVVLFGQR